MIYTSFTKKLAVLGMGALLIGAGVAGCNQTGDETSPDENLGYESASEPAGGTEVSAEPAADLPPGVEAVAPGETLRIDFTKESGATYLGEGWAAPDESGRWSKAESASVTFYLTEVGDPTVTLSARTYGEQNVTAELNGEEVQVNVSSASEEVSLDIPKEVFETENTLTFNFPDRRSPQEVKGTADTRPLGMNVAWMEIQN